MANPRAGISVVIPAFNAAEHLPRAIRSALAQTRRPEEIIVVDDGSTDDTAEVADSFGAPVRCLRKANGGAAEARNLGIAEATGEFVAFLDADAEWLPHRLEAAARIFEARPELAWCSTRYRWEPESLLIHPTPPAEMLGADGFIEDFFAAAGSWEMGTSTLVIRRDVLEAVGAFDTAWVTGEDRDLWFRIGLDHPSIGFTPQVSVIEHRREGSLSRQSHFTAERAAALLESCLDRASDRGADDARRVRPLLRRWACQVVRKAVAEEDREALRWVEAHFGTELPVGLRLASLGCRSTPSPIWRIALWTWSRSLPLRVRLHLRNA